MTYQSENDAFENDLPAISKFNKFVRLHPVTPDSQFAEALEKCNQDGHER